MLLNKEVYRILSHSPLDINIHFVLARLREKNSAINALRTNKLQVKATLCYLVWKQEQVTAL